MFSNHTNHGWSNETAIGTWQRVVLIGAIIVSIASGVAAFTFLSATHPVEHRVTWVLVPPRHKMPVARMFATADLLAVEAFAKHGT